MINKFTVFETSTQRIAKKDIISTLEKYSSSKTEHAAIVGKIKAGNGSHFLNIEGISYDKSGKMMVDVFDTSNQKRQSLPVSDFQAIEVTTWKKLGESKDD